MAENNRISICGYKGKSIYIIDYSGLTHDEIAAVVEDGMKIGESLKEKVLLIGNFTGVKVDRKILSLMIKSTKPFAKKVEKGAVVGLNRFRGFIRAANLFTEVKAMPFDTLEEAKDWIVE